MIFQKRPRKSVDVNFNIGTEPTEIVQEYTYLGTRLTPTGNFTLAVEHLKEQESQLGISTGHSDPPHPSVSQMLARSSIYTNRRDEKCDCVTRYFDYNVTG